MCEVTNNGTSTQNGQRIGISHLLKVGLAGLATLAAPSHLLSAGELLITADAETAAVVDTSGNPLVRSNIDAKEGTSSYLFEKLETVVFGPLVPIDPKKTYELSAYMRSVDGENPASANFGVIMYDKHQRPIQLCNVDAFTETQTELLAPVVKGDQEVRVADAASWQKYEHARIAFHAKKNLSDLPNFNLSPIFSKTEKTEGGWKVVFKEPLDADYPQGTAVRLHLPWTPGLYWVADEWVPTQWKKYATTLHGEASVGTPIDQFWAGARYVRIMVRLGNWNRVPRPGAQLLVDEVRFREVLTP